MKLVLVSVQFQYADRIASILEGLEIQDYVRHSRVDGRDSDGRHDGSQVFPGHVTAFQILVDDEGVKELLEALREFREGRSTQQHLRAAVVALEDGLF